MSVSVSLFFVFIPMKILSDKILMAEEVDSIILQKLNRRAVKEPVSLILTMFTKRCKHLHIACVILSLVGVNRLIRVRFAHHFFHWCELQELPELAKDVYLFVRVESNVPKRKLKAGTLNVEIAFDGSSYLEIWYDGMKRRHIASS